MNEGQERGETRLHRSPVDSEQFKLGVRPPHVVGRRFPAPATQAGNPLCFPKSGVALAQGRLCPLEVVDIGTGAVPPGDGSIGGSRRHLTGDVPAIHPVRAADAELNFPRDAAAHGRGPHGHGVGQVVRVDDFFPGPAEQVIRPQAGVRGRLGVQVNQTAIGGGGKDDLGDGVGQFTEPSLALPHGLFRLLAFGNVAGDANQPDHRAGLVLVRSRRGVIGAADTSGDKRVFHGDHPVARHDRSISGHHPFRLGCVEQVGVVPAQYIFRILASETGGGPIDQPIATPHVLDEHGNGGPLDNGPQQIVRPSHSGDFTPHQPEQQRGGEHHKRTPLHGGCVVAVDVRVAQPDQCQIAQPDPQQSERAVNERDSESRTVDGRAVQKVLGHEFEEVPMRRSKGLGQRYRGRGGEISPPFQDATPSQSARSSREKSKGSSIRPRNQDRVSLHIPQCRPSTIGKACPARPEPEDTSLHAGANLFAIL